MTREAKRTRLATGIFRDKYGISIIVKVNGVQVERRYPIGSDLDRLILKRAELRIAQRDEALDTIGPSLAKAITAYLKTIPADTRRHEDAERHLRAWSFQHVPPAQITPALIREQIAQWQTEGAAPSTINHRRQELKNLYTLINGKAGANPVRDVPKVRERYDDARGQDPRVIEAIFAEMPESDTKIRLRVWWETAIPPADMIRLQRTGFHPKAKTQFVPARLKGHGVPGQTLELSRGGVAALSAFYAAGLEGRSFSHHSAYKSFKLAVSKAQAAWKGPWPAPQNLSPKDLRHSRLTEAYKRSQDLNAVAKLGRHSSLSTTQRYVRAAQSVTARRAVRLMEATIPALPADTAQTVKKRSLWKGRRSTGTPRQKR